MSRSYELILKKGKKGKTKFEEFIIGDFYISGSNMTANDIFTWNINKETNLFLDWEVDNFLKSAKLNLQKEYNYIKKDLAVVFMADLKWVDIENLKSLKKAIKDLVEKDLKDVMNNFVIELNWITKVSVEWEFKLLKLLLLLDILNSDELIETTNSYKETDVYIYIKNNFWDKLEETEKELLEIRDKMTDLMAKMDILQELFSSYESKYVDKEYVLSSFVSNYDDILTTLKIIIFCEISKIYNLDIYYNY